MYLNQLREYISVEIFCNRCLAAIHEEGQKLVKWVSTIEMQASCIVVGGLLDFERPASKILYCVAADKSFSRSLDYALLYLG